MIRCTATPLGKRFPGYDGEDCYLPLDVFCGDWPLAAILRPSDSGALRVVIAKERTGPQFFYCTDVNASAADLIEIFAVRAAIEQVFHDVKEVWGSGQQQVRNLWTNIAVWHRNLWMHTLAERWAGNRSAKPLAHRHDSPHDSPWDDADRRPSHAHHRKALQAALGRRIFVPSPSHARNSPNLPHRIDNGCAVR